MPHEKFVHIDLANAILASDFWNHIVLSLLNRDFSCWGFCAAAHDMLTKSACKDFYENHKPIKLDASKLLAIDTTCATKARQIYLTYFPDGYNLAKEVNKSLPSSLKKEFYQSHVQINNLNNYKVKFAIFGSMIDFPKPLENMPDIDVTAI